MNRTIKDATVKRFYYEAHDELRVHLANFVTAYNFAKRLKTLKGLTPYEYICKVWTKEPERFSLNPLQQMPGLNTITSSSSVRPICAGSLPATPTITTNSERICPWARIRRPIGRFTDMVRSQRGQCSADFIINTAGYSCQQGQGLSAGVSLFPAVTEAVVVLDFTEGRVEGAELVADALDR
jgi:hypothetical protein